MDKEKQLELDIADTIIDRPKGFSVGSRHFYLYPITLGKMYLQKRIIDGLELNRELLKVSPYAEALRLSSTKKEDCCLLLAYHTLQTKEEVLNNIEVIKRKNFFMKEMSTEDIATLILSCLTGDRTILLMQHFGIDKELERMSEVMKVKDSKNSFSFGGKSIYGTMIDAACERYKWTYDYVVWEISYTNLQLMLKDSIKSIYLTDDEMKKAHINNTSNMVDGNSKEDIMNAINGSSWK